MESENVKRLHAQWKVGTGESGVQQQLLQPYRGDDRRDDCETAGRSR